MKSLKSKMIINMSISIIVIIAIIVSVVGINTRKNSLESAYESTEIQGRLAAKQVEQELEDSMDTARTLANSFEGLKQAGIPDRKKINSILKNVLAENPEIFGLWTIWEPNAFDGEDEVFKNTDGHDETGRFIPYWYYSGDSIELIPCEGYKTQGSGDYYLKAKNSGEEIILEPYTYEINGKQILMTSLSVPIKIDGKVIGVVGTDISLEKLQAISDEIKLYKSGYGVIISNLGTYVTHKKEELLGTNIIDTDMNNKEEMKKAIESGEYFNTIAISEVNNKENYMQQVPIKIGNTKTPWSVAVSVPINEVTQKTNKLIQMLIIIGILGLLVLIGIIYIISSRIASPIKVLSDIIDKLSNYDLTLDKNSKAVKYTERKDEIGIISRALTTMQQNLISLIKNISHDSEQVASSSEELTATSQQSSTAAEEVARTIEEIARGAGEQAKNTENGAANINVLGNLIEKNQQNIRGLNESTKEVDLLKNEGIDILKELVKKTDENNMALKEVNEVIMNTNESAKKIENASQMIKSIAEQTNLLSLNAAIEAARAGESGKGFAVVANEIRKLAEQSNEFTEEIANIIGELTDKTEKAVDNVKQIDKIAASQTESVEKTSERFEGINHAIEKMKEVIKNINNSGEEMEVKKNEIIDIIENLSAISEENAAGTEEASASVEEQTASMEEIANASEALAKLAEEMQESISKFKF